MKVVLLTGPSGCGKSRLTKRSGLPVLKLDDFYFSESQPDLPKRFGIVDWDDPRSWDAAGAITAIKDLCNNGTAEVPIYDIRLNAPTGTKTITAENAPIMFAEGVFAGELVKPMQQAGLLAQAICLKRRRIVSFWFRLTRDIKERRKPIPTLIRRGWALMREEPALIQHWASQGCQPMRLKEAKATIESLKTSPP